MVTDTKPPPRRMGKDERRENFLDMAAEIIVEQGIEAVTMEGIAARAGVNKALPYRFFANRDAALVALFDRETASFDERIRAAIEGATDFEDRLRALVGVWLDDIEAGTHKVTAALDLVRTQSGELEKRREARLAQIVLFFVDDLTALGVKKADAFLAASVLMAGSQGLVVLWLNAGQSRTKLTDRFVHLCMGAVHSLLDG